MCVTLTITCPQCTYLNQYSYTILCYLKNIPCNYITDSGQTTPPLFSVYKTRTKHGHQSESHTLSLLRLQNPHEAWSPVRVTHSLSPLPTRPAQSMVAGTIRVTHPERSMRSRWSHIHFHITYPSHWCRTEEVGHG